MQGPSTGLKSPWLRFCPLVLSVSLFLGCHPRNAKFIRVTSDSVALTHVRVIDGTGASAKDDQTIIIQSGRIRDIGDSNSISLAGIAQIMELRGYTAIPGLVGMHDHLFYAVPPGNEFREMLPSFPELYLAAGVTSIRTAGALDIRAERRMKERIEAGKDIGPHLYLSTPYVDPDPGSPENPAGYSKAVEQLISGGIDSVKVYTHARTSELAAVIQVAHRSGVRVTGHLCAIGFTQAALLGIDNLEHGLIVDSEFYSQPQPGACPDWGSTAAELARMEVHGPEIQRLIGTLVQRHVAITSTLPVFESFSATRIPQLDDRVTDLLVPELRIVYTAQKDVVSRGPDAVWGPMLKKEMEFEREFVRAGGLLVAGVDPTGWGGVIAGYGDQHEVELLVESGFTPEQAIQIATYNGAVLLGHADQVGTLLRGKEADIAVVRGNPSSAISDIRHTELVFKDGVGYDSAAILKSLAGRVGVH